MYKQSKIHLLETLNQIESGEPISVALVSIRGQQIKTSFVMKDDGCPLVGAMEILKCNVIKSIPMNVIADPQPPVSEFRQLSLVSDKDEKNE